MDAHQGQRIAQGLRAGDVAAWHALYDAQVESIWRIVARRLGPASSETADVVQEIFLEAARGARNFDPAEGSLGAWLRGIARRQLSNHFRRRARFERSGRATEAEQRTVTTLVRYLDGGHPGPSQAIETSETAHLVREALATLPEDYQSLLTGKYLDELTVEALADDLGTSIEAARSKLARARRAFRQALTAIAGEDIAPTPG